MSPNVGNFVHDLVEMAKAMETLPQVEAELAEVKNRLNDREAHNAALEGNIQRYKEEIEALQSKVRATEAERDDAELRFLELEDKSVNILAMAKAARVSLDQMTGLLDPPKAEPEPIVDHAAEALAAEPFQPSVPEAVQSIEPQPQGQGEGDPTASQTSGSVIQPSSGNTQGETPQPPASQDQSEVNPTNELSSGSGTAEIGQGSSSEPKPSGPYTDKRYFYHAGYVSFYEWIRGGGTEADYNWRPTSNNDF